MMHELCGLLIHVSTFFYIYDVISMLYIDFWGFTNDPLYFCYNSTGQENPVCVFLAFRDLNKVKRSYDSRDVNISSKEATEALGTHEKGQVGQKSPGA
jgi:hypothetical protein